MTNLNSSSAAVAKSFLNALKSDEKSFIKVKLQVLGLIGSMMLSLSPDQSISNPESSKSVNTEPT